MFWSKRDTSKVKNILIQRILPNILENQTFQKKFIMVDSYEMDLQLLKVDEMCRSWSLLAAAYWSWDEDGIGWSKFLLKPGAGFIL